MSSMRLPKPYHLSRICLSTSKSGCTMYIQSKTSPASLNSSRHILNLSTSWQVPCDRFRGLDLSVYHCSCHTDGCSKWSRRPSRHSASRTAHWALYAILDNSASLATFKPRSCVSHTSRTSGSWVPATVAMHPAQLVCPVRITCLTLTYLMANSRTAQVLRSVGSTMLAMLRWTNASPGWSPSTVVSGTRESAQPIQTRRDS